MPQLTRYTPSLFSNSSTAAASVGVFGSLAASSPATSTNPNTIQSLSAWSDGWPAAVVGTNQPALEDMNGLFYWLSYYINYGMQVGVPEYDSGTTYYKNALVNNMQNTSIPYGIYVSQVDNNIYPLVASGGGVNTAYWLPFAQTLSGPNLCKAWVNFDGTTNSGGNCTILGSSPSISSVTYVSTGVYQINFVSGAFTSAAYAWSGSAGGQNGVTYNNNPGGDNNVITGSAPGITAVKTTSTLQICCWEPYGGSHPALENSGSISVIIFGN